MQPLEVDLTKKDNILHSTTHEFTSGLLWFEVLLFLLKMSFPFISSSKYFSCTIASWHIVDETQNFFNNCGKIEVIMIVKKFKSAITYFNVMISSFSPELPLVRRQMRGGEVGARKELRPILSWNQAKISKYLWSWASIMIQEIKEGSWLQFNAILPEIQTFGNGNEKQLLNLNLNF